MKTPLSFLFVSSLMMASPAGAQELGMGAAASGPVGITADELELRQNEKLYVARGNAVVEQSGTTITANQMSAPYIETADGKQTIVKVEADGGVHIKNDKAEAFGDKGVYDTERQVAVLLGQNLKLVTPQDTVTARDSLEFWQAQNLAVAKGNAVAKREGQELRADTLTALLEKDKDGKQSISRVSADGHVVIVTKEEVVQADKGTYDTVKEKAVMTGHVQITRGKNQLNGDRAEIDMKTGVSRLISTKGSRVQGLLVPQDAPRAATPKATSP